MNGDSTGEEKISFFKFTFLFLAAQLQLLWLYVDGFS